MINAAELFDGVDWVPHCRCPKCGSSHIETTDTEPVDEHTHTRKRYHRCRVKSCRAIFKSVECLVPTV